jgi:hypothetical protein
MSVSDGAISRRVSTILFAERGDVSYARITRALRGAARLGAARRAVDGVLEVHSL